MISHHLLLTRWSLEKSWSNFSITNLRVLIWSHPSMSIYLGKQQLLLQILIHSTVEWLHDDVIKWKHFPRYWTFVLVTGELPTQRPVMRSFDVFFHLRQNKVFSKQWWGWWFETPSHSLWHHCNVTPQKDGESITPQYSVQATGLDAWASRVKCPAQFVSHLHDICIYISCL